MEEVAKQYVEDSKYSEKSKYNTRKREKRTVLSETASSSNKTETSISSGKRKFDYITEEDDVDDYEWSEQTESAKRVEITPILVTLLEDSDLSNGVSLTAEKIYNLKSRTSMLTIKQLAIALMQKLTFEQVRISLHGIMRRIKSKKVSLASLVPQAHRRVLKLSEQE